jgi:hypothetical protein
MRAVPSFFAVLVIALSPAIGAAFSSPPTGSLSCSVFSELSTTHPAGILFHPYIDAVPRLLRVKAANVGSTCDNSGVTGGRAPITGVAFKLSGRMEDATCGTFTAMPSFKNGWVKVKWRGLNAANHPTTVASSRARIVSSSYDSGSHALIVTTEPLIGAGFTNEVVVLHLGIAEAVDYIESGCNGSGLLGFAFGNSNAATLEVQ